MNAMPPSPRQPPPDPGLAEKARNLAGAVAGFVADGGRIAPPEIQAARRAECERCENLVNAKCRLCGCVLMDAKRAMASSTCPDSPPRWRAV
jgi:hypothetical protein